MERRLIKIAKELNVGTQTIVDHLNHNGFDVENKPTAKITDEMYSVLLKEFQKSLNDKEKADQMIIGNRATTTTVKKELPVTPATRPERPSFPKSEGKPDSGSAEGHTEEKSGDLHVEERPRLLSNRLKVLGKIELDARGNRIPEVEKIETPPPAPPPPPPAPEPVAVVVETPVEPVRQEQEQAPPATPTPPTPVEIIQPKMKSEPAPVPEPKKPEVVPTSEAEIPKSVKDDPEAKPVAKGDENLMRAATPELRGLKIQGKIDIDKFKKPQKKKDPRERDKPKPQQPGTGNAPDQRPAAPGDERKKPQPGGAAPGTPGSAADDAAKKKRKRKRKKLNGPNEGGGNTQPGGNTQQSGGGGGGNTQSGGGGGGGGDQNRARRTSSGGGGGSPQGGGQRSEPTPELSQREIEEKIKATMARISGAGGKKKRQKLSRDKRDRFRERQELIDLEKEGGKLQLTEFISVSELASLMDVSVSEVIMTCMNIGVIVSINQRLDAEVIELVASEFGHEVEFISAEEQVDEVEDMEEDSPEDLVPRAPVVTVMGHVDHGKTSLLDYIREANVVGGEAGGITQHIGAYEVQLPNGKEITFLDTPGHEAFTAMRARGAKVTDIAVIIVAADDNIMPQTKEAISHATAANVPIIFAINKIDKAGAAPEKIKQELASMNFLVEEWGGKYQSQDISAKTGANIELLLEKILLEAELLDLKANPKRLAVGAVIEASLDKGRGYVTKILVQSGTLKIGSPIVAGEHAGKVKAMFNERGKRVTEAGPSTPVLVLGLSGAPQAGERFKSMENEFDTRQLASKRAQITREQTNRATKRISLDEIGRRLALGNFKELNLIVKGDVDGSVEALSDSLMKLAVETVQVNVIHRAVGQIIESDVLLASASDAIIIGFQVRPSGLARKLAEREGVEIKMYSIIYEAIEEIKAAIEGMLEPTKEEKIVAQVEVRQVFKVSKVGTVAGCYVQEGKISRNTGIRIVRDGIVVFPVREGAAGKISSLKRLKDDVKEVREGLECGIALENFNDIRVGDIIEGFEITEVRKKL